MIEDLRPFSPAAQTDTIEDMEIDRNGLEVLERDECLQLVRDASLGRLGLTSGALPTVLPVNYWADDEGIYVRTERDRN